MPGLESAFLDDRRRFPRGYEDFDSARVMKGLDHEWRGTGAINSYQRIGEWRAAPIAVAFRRLDMR